MWYPAQMWSGAGFTGQVYNLPYDTPGVSQVNISAGSITSLKIQPFSRLIIYNRANYEGLGLLLFGPLEIPDLAKYNANFNKNILSYKLINIIPHADITYQCCQGDLDKSYCGEYVPNGAVCEGIPSPCNLASRLDRPECQAWCTANPTKCLTQKQLYCTDDVKRIDPFCGATVEEKIVPPPVKLRITPPNTLIWVFFFILLVLTAVVVGSSIYVNMK